jgi:hypothetical protein
VGVVICIARENEDVVEVNDDAHVDHSFKDRVHHALKSCGRITETEGHNSEFKQPISGRERCESG